MTGDHSIGSASDLTTAADRHRIALALTISVAILLVEVIGAAQTGSLALFADASHMLADVAGLVLALVAVHLRTRPATSRRTWGYERVETLAAAVQALLLLGTGVYVLVESIRRLVEPAQITSTEMLMFGIVGLVGNSISLAVLTGSRGRSLNLRAALLEVVNDICGSAAVVVAAIVIATTGWTRADAVVSLLIAILILPRTAALLGAAARVLLEVTPAGLDLDDVRAHILKLDHVYDIYDLHASQIATGLPVLTAHVVVDAQCFYDGHLVRLLDDLQICVATHFPVSIDHSTFQLEQASHRHHGRSQC